MHRPRALASGVLLALLLGACGTSAPLVPTETPRPTSVERCAGLRWTDVRDALAAVDHYTYRGTDRIVFDPTVPGPSPFVADRTVDGAYQAPDRAREISEWATGIDPMAQIAKDTDDDGGLDPNVRRDVDQGEVQIDNGNLQGARILFKRAAVNGSARAAMLLGGSYDPSLIAAYKTAIPPKADIAEARRWYQRAIELGGSRANHALKQLP